jgi:mRNA-degrading endonuclease RelE of RelBE toxin-antitoxin system
MFEFELSDLLSKKIFKLNKKDKVLTKNFCKKVKEIISRNHQTIDSYKNLKKPDNDKKRVHLTDEMILLFNVNKEENTILFIDIVHWGKAY